MSAEKVVRDGKVAVLVSPEHGAGWSTWNKNAYPPEAMLFSPEPTRLNSVSHEFVPDDVRAEWLEVYTKEWRRRITARVQGLSRGVLTTLAPEMVEVLQGLAAHNAGDGVELHRLKKLARALLKKIETDGE